MGVGNIVGKLALAVVGSANPKKARSDTALARWHLLALVGTHWQCQPKEFEGFVDGSLEYADQVKAKRLRVIGAFWVLAN